MSNTAFISAINDQIRPLIKAFPGARLEGIAQSMIRKHGEQLQLVPSLVDKDGEGKYIGIDDAAPITLYHKANSINITDKPGSGYGDSRGDKVFTFQNSMIILLNRKATKLLPDEFIMMLQGSFWDALKIPNYKSVNIRFQNIILNSQQVFVSEYQNTEYKVHPVMSLFAINYQIESVFDKNCFATCP